MQPTSSRASRRQYLEWVEEQIETYKESVSRSDLLRIAEQVVAEIRVNTTGQYQITELLLLEAVDRKIFQLLKLPTYRTWSSARRAGVDLAGPGLASESV